LMVECDFDWLASRPMSLVRLGQPGVNWYRKGPRHKWRLFGVTRP